MKKSLTKASFKTIKNTRIVLEEENDILYLTTVKVFSLSDYEAHKDFYKSIRTFSNCVYCFSSSAYCESTFARIMMFKLCKTKKEFDNLLHHSGNLKFGVKKL